jgi:PST family polysaccharide transporter
MIDVLMLLVLARLLVPADFGLVALAMVVISIVDIVLEVPVTQALTRLPAIERSHLDTGFTLGLIRAGIVILVVAAVSWPMAWFYRDDRLVELLLVLSAGPAMRGLYNPAMVKFVRSINFRYAVFAELTGKVYGACLALSIASSGGGYWALAAGSVAGPFITSVVSYGLSPYRPRITLERLGDFASFVGWFSAAQIIAALNWQYDRMLLGRTLDRGSFGQFAMASDVAVLPTQSLIGPAMQPVMAALARLADDRERIRAAFLKAVRFAMLVSVPVSLGMALTGDLAVGVLLGPAWREAAPILQGLALAVVTIPYFQATYSLALAVDRPSAVFRLNVIDLALRVGLVALGLWWAGVTGVVVARCLLGLTLLGLCLAAVRALVGIPVRSQLRNLWKVAAAGAVMSAAVMALRAGLSPQAVAPLPLLLACAATGAIVYAAALWVLGVRLIVGRGRFEVTDA